MHCDSAFTLRKIFFSPFFNVCSTILLLVASPIAAFAQSGQWTWMGGSKAVDGLGVYGTLATPAAANLPGSRWGSATWTDRSGNLWLFGGGYTVGAGTSYRYSDLWKFNPGTIEWTWMGGTGNWDRPGVYGTRGTASAANIPGARNNGVTWVDSSGDVWIFGGVGFDSADVLGMLNDMWKFDPTSGSWTWISGSSTVVCGELCGKPGVYGTRGVAAKGNTPGGRYSATGWIDSSEHFWLFGGYGADSVGTWGYLNDLWEFNPSTAEWTWIAGSKTTPNDFTVGGIAGVYGQKGVASGQNAPGSRYQALAWVDSDGDFWMLGGKGFDAAGTRGYMNDLWQFDPNTKEWVWKSGAETVPGQDEGISGTYGAQGVANAANQPGSRVVARGFPDGKGNLWLFGGWGFDSTGATGELNDLWKLNASSKEWTWVDGSKTLGTAYCVTILTEPDCGQRGVYGTLGEPGATTGPGGRQDVSSWIDRDGNLWLFGGYGFDSTGAIGSLNDMWVFESGVPTTTAAMPTFLPKPGKFTSAQKITLTSTTPGAKIYYTLDKSTPSASKTHYTSSIQISKTTTIMAIAIAPGYKNSPIATGLFAILKPQTITWPKITGTHYAKTKLALNASASSGLAVTYASLTTKVCTVTGTKASFLVAGTCKIRASQAGNSVYAPAAPVPQSIVVSPAP